MDARERVSVKLHGGGRLTVRGLTSHEQQDLVLEALRRLVRLRAEVDREFLRRFLLERGVPSAEADVLTESASLDDETYAGP